MEAAIKPRRKNVELPPPATTIEGRENQLIAAATDLAFQRILEGSASSQLLTHFLKLGTVKAQLELEAQSKKIELMTAKTEAYRAEKANDALFQEAIAAMTRYSGKNREENYSD